MGSSSKVVRPEEVLESLKNDGSIDALRMKIIAQLKANVRAGFPSAPDSPPIPFDEAFYFGSSCYYYVKFFVV